MTKLAPLNIPKHIKNTIFMKKLYLAFMAAAATFSATAAEPTLTQMWSKIYDWNADAWGWTVGNEPSWNATENVMGTATGSRWGVGMDGKIYSINCFNNSLISFDGESMNPTAVKLPSLTGKTITYWATDAGQTKKTAPDFYATLLSRDDAGHFIVGHGFTTGAMPVNWTVLDPKTGANKTFYMGDMGFGEDNKASYQRIDAVGRVVGDVTMDGYLYVAPTSVYWPNIKDFQPTWATAAAVQKTKIIAFQGEGEFNDNMVATGYTTPYVSLGNQTASICQPRFESVSELFDFVGEDESKLAETYILYSKANSDCLENNKYAAQFGVETATEGSNASLETIADMYATDIVGTNYASYVGFDTFTLGGKRYFVANYQTKDENKACTGTMHIAVFDEAGMLVKEWSNPDYMSSYGYCSISTEAVADDANSRYIYVYCATGRLKPNDTQAAAAAMLKFTAGDSAGIDDIAVEDAQVAPVYYNLQGVEVANPENGIYVVRRGNKVTKEVVR